MINFLKKTAGAKNVISSKEELYPYAFCAAQRDEAPVLPDAVVFVESVEQISKIMEYANSNNIPVTARASATGHDGGVVPKRGGIVIHFSKMNNIIDVNKDNLVAKVQAGVVLGDFQKEVEKIGLFFPPDPSNLAVSTVGGALALSSGGPRTFKYGTMKDYVLSLQVVLPDGKIINTGTETIKNVTGYNLTQLFVGSEGTLGMIASASLRLIPKPPYKRLILAYFDKIEYALMCVNGIISSLLLPATLDLIDKKTTQTIENFCPCGFLTDKEAVLFIEVDGYGIEEQGEKVVQVCKESGACEVLNVDDENLAQKIWTSRRSSFGAVARLKPHVATEDVVVPRSRILELVEGVRKLSEKYNITTLVMGHAGDGNIHPNFALDLNDNDEKMRFEKLKDELFALALSLGGTLSGEHGIGFQKSKYLKNALSPNELSAMRKIKALFDPKGILKSFLPE